MGHLGRSHYIGVHSPFVVFPTTNVISSVLHGDLLYHKIVFIDRKWKYRLDLKSDFNCGLNVVANFAHHRMFSPQLLFVRTIQTVIDQTRRRSNSHLDVSFFMPTIIVLLPSDKIKNCSQTPTPFYLFLGDWVIILVKSQSRAEVGLLSFPGFAPFQKYGDYTARKWPILKGQAK